MAKKLSKATVGNLLVIYQLGPVSPAEFAQRAWPDKPHRCHRAGHGQGGNNMALCAGGVLGKLVKGGLARWTTRGYELTDLGRTKMVADT
jgi:hypothetical protein